MDLESSPCILPAAEKTHSTPADEAGAAKYTILLHHQFTILARLGHLGSFSFHQLSTLMLMSVLRVGEGLLQLVERQSLALGSAAAFFLIPPPSRPSSETYRNLRPQPAILEIARAATGELTSRYSAHSAALTPWEITDDRTRARARAHTVLLVSAWLRGLTKVLSQISAMRQLVS